MSDTDYTSSDSEENASTLKQKSASIGNPLSNVKHVTDHAWSRPKEPSNLAEATESSQVVPTVQQKRRRKTPVTGKVAKKTSDIPSRAKQREKLVRDNFLRALAEISYLTPKKSSIVKIEVAL